MQFFIPDPDPEELAKAKTAAQAVTAEVSHLHQWLTELDEHTARKIEMLLQVCLHREDINGTFLVTLRTSNHMRFGLCLNCGKDHRDQVLTEELIGHTAGHRPTREESHVDELERTPPSLTPRPTHRRRPSAIEELKDRFPWLRNL